MKTKILTFVGALMFFMSGFALSATVEGEYKGVSGKVGIYSMTAMTIEKNASGDKYTVKFAGERSLTYKSAELIKDKIQINDKGFILGISIDGDKATVDPSSGGAVFKRVKK